LLLPALAALWPSVASGHELEKPVPFEELAPTWPPGVSTERDVVVPVILTISSEGVVTDVEVEASLGPDFDSAAIAAARRWVFAPARSEGVAVASKVRAVVRFRAEIREEAPAAPATGTERKPSDAARAAVTKEEENSTSSIDPVTPLGHGEDQHLEVHVISDRAPPRSASEVIQERRVLEAAPHRTANDMLLTLPGFSIAQHGGEGDAYQIFFRGFDAVHGQDLEIWAGGAPVNDVSNIHGQGYADLHFLPAEVVKQVRSMPGTYDPRQGDFSVAGSVLFDLGYDEPGITAKASTGQYGNRRYFLGYHPEKSSEATFAAFELYSTDGFGPARAATRASGVAQAEFNIADGTVARVMASTYATSYDSPGVLVLSDVESGRVGRFASYDQKQGGDASRSQLVLDLTQVDDESRWSIAPYVVLHSMRLRQDYTGYLVEPYTGSAAEVTAFDKASAQGNSEQQINEATTFGVKSYYRRMLRLFTPTDTVEGGLFARLDWITQSQKKLSIDMSEVTFDEVDANIRATNLGGYLDLALHPLSRLVLRGGVRLDGLSYAVQDNGPQGLGARRSAQGAHMGKKGTAEVRIGSGLSAVASYGDGFRSPQARSLQQGQTAPFTTVQSFEGGLRYLTPDYRASVAVFRTLLSDDLAFDQATARNERTPPTRRTGLSADITATPRPWFTSSTSITYTRAEFTNTDGGYNAGDLLPYAPQIVMRSDMAVTPTLGTAFERPLTARLGVGLSYLGLRPLPYGQFGHDVFLADATASLRLKEVQLSANVYNVLDAKWYDGEYVFASNFTRSQTPSLVPERHVTVGAPRTALFTLAIYL
jgi:TonB family protein